MSKHPQQLVGIFHQHVCVHTQPCIPPPAVDIPQTWPSSTAASLSEWHLLPARKQEFILGSFLYFIFHIQSITK